MRKGGFGNLFALPLQFAPRKLCNSVFIDTDFDPYPDQRHFLSTIRRMAGDAAEQIVAEAQRKGDLIGVRMSIARTKQRSSSSQSMTSRVDSEEYDRRWRLGDKCSTLVWDTPSSTCSRRRSRTASSLTQLAIN